jgi:hypothetical protein
VISQVEAARLIYAAAVWVEAERAVVDAGLTKPMGTPVDWPAVRKSANAAQQHFEQLVSKLTESE